MDISEINGTKYIIRTNRKTTSASLPDILSIIENCEKKEDDRFWYVIFDDINKNLEELYDLTGGWKTTKF